MRFLLFSIALLPGSANADDKIFKWILRQYEAKNPTVIDSQVGGQINGEEFIAIVARDVDPEMDVDTSGKEQYLGLFKQSQDKLVGVALARLAHVGDQNHPRVEIGNNSIFLSTSHCHHGCGDTRYQFKNVGQQLKLVGIESQGETWCSYHDDKNAPADCNYSVRSGNSYNLLSSTTICWSEIEPEGQLPSNPPKQYQPRGVQHKMTFSKMVLPLLDGFNLDKFLLPKSCYLDSNKRVHVYEPNP